MNWFRCPRKLIHLPLCVVAYSCIDLKSRTPEPKTLHVCIYIYIFYMATNTEMCICTYVYCIYVHMCIERDRFDIHNYSAELGCVPY